VCTDWDRHKTVVVVHVLVAVVVAAVVDHGHAAGFLVVGVLILED